MLHHCAGPYVLSQPALERFEVRSRVGAGSFGTVFEAFDRQRNRVVALKVLSLVSHVTVARFKREFRTLASLRHPNLASLYELVVLGDQWLLTMEMVRGTDLLEHLAFIELQESFLQERPDFDGDERVVFRRRGRTVSAYYIEQVRAAFQQLATALAVLHSNGVIHRDIKPSNIMIARDGRVVVLDFGLAVETALDDSLDRRTIVGTPGYMSPEQIAAKPPTAASDWYSFGVLLHQALTGKMPFDAPTPIDILRQQVEIEPPHANIIVPGVPDDLASLAFDCMQRDPLARPSDMQILERLGIADFDPGRIERARTRSGPVSGRGRELRTLETWLDLLQPGEPRVFLISGDPGAGKSSLIDVFLDRVRARGDAMILAGRCQPWESVPFNAVDGVVDSLAREIRHAKTPEVLDALGRSAAVAELFQALDGIAPPALDETVAIPQGDRLVSRAAAELRAVVEAAAGGRIAVIVVDDAQWGDYASARILSRLAATGGKGRIAVVLSFTADDWRTSLLLQGLDLEQMEPKPRRLELGPLSRRTTAKMIREKLGRASHNIVDRLHRESGGNPALIEMALADGNGSLAAAVQARLASLSAAARSLFDIVFASEVPVEQNQLEQTLELIESDEALRSLSAQRLIRIRRTGNLAEVSPFHERLRLSSGA